MPTLLELYGLEPAPVAPVKRSQDSVDWSQFTTVKPEGAGVVQTVAPSDSIGLGVLPNLGIAIAIGYGLFRLISPRSISSPIHVGLKWFAWTTMGWCIVELPRFFRKFDADSLALWLLGIVMLGSLSLLAGWSYARFITPRTFIKSGGIVGRSESTPVATDSAIVRRLRDLENLRQQGLISESEYNDQRQRIIREV